MKHFFIITNVKKDIDLGFTTRIKEYIEEKGGTCDYFVSEGAKSAKTVPTKEEIPDNTECVLVLGGDGTLIRTAAGMVAMDLPLIGINLGTLGYLCELEAKDAFAAVDRLMEDSYVIEERMLLTGHAKMHDGNTEEHLALNEVSIHRSGSLSVISLKIYVNGQYLHTFHGDGIIVSTPTGSTGYSMSAGGPIVDPKARMILLTPINAHNLNSRSIVIGADNEVMIELTDRRAQKDESASVIFDGDGVAKLNVGDQFVVKCADATVKICKLSEESFLEIIRKKMQTYV